MIQIVFKVSPNVWGLDFIHFDQSVFRKSTKCQWVSYDRPIRRNEENMPKMWKFSILVDYFSKIIFCVKHFPISSKVTKNTLQGDTDSSINATESLRSRIFTYPARVGPQNPENCLILSAIQHTVWENRQKLEISDFGCQISNILFLYNRISHKLESW